MQIIILCLRRSEFAGLVIVMANFRMIEGGFRFSVYVCASIYFLCVLCINRICMSKINRLKLLKLSGCIAPHNFRWYLSRVYAFTILLYYICTNGLLQNRKLIIYPQANILIKIKLYREQNLQIQENKQFILSTLTYDIVYKYFLSSIWLWGFERVKSKPIHVHSPNVKFICLFILWMQFLYQILK